MSDTVKRTTFTVITDDPDDPDAAPAVERSVTVRLGDQLHAELEGQKLALDPKQMPIHALALWVWSAMWRTGDTTVGFLEWRDTVVAIDRPDKAEPRDVDPTRTGHPPVLPSV